MNIEYFKFWSDSLGQDVEIKTYGQAGKPVLVFPCQGGRFYEFEDFHMLDAVGWLIEAGRYRFYTVDSLDNQSWVNFSIHPADRALRHAAYDRYLSAEAAPFIRQHSGWQGGLAAYGSSMGAYHAANLYLRHPEQFDLAISLSGLYQLSLFIGDYCDETVYMHTPLYYLPDLADPWYLERYQQGRIVLCCGQGAWEEPMLSDTRALGKILADKGIPHWLDIWGYDVNHDWPWWRKMLPYFLEKL